eukprot:6921213-Prymnesium_polylepis.1
MNFLGATLLGLCGEVEEEAFVLLVALIRKLPHDFYAESPPLHGFHVETGALRLLVESRLP